MICSARAPVGVPPITYYELNVDEQSDVALNRRHELSSFPVETLVERHVRKSYGRGSELPVLRDQP